MMKSKVRSVIAAALWLLFVMGWLTVTGVKAQSNDAGGSIQGTVRDEAGAVLPGAKVLIRQLETGREVNTVTNENGFFVTPPVNIGRYRIRVEARGMKAWQSEALVETGRATVVEPKLALGAVSETIEVSGNIAPLVTTNEPGDAVTLDQQRISELPINGRSVVALLVATTPGAETTNPDGGRVHIGGLTPEQTDFQVNGTSLNDREQGGGGGGLGLESVAEVRIETSTSSVRLNRPSSVLANTKSGSNKLHGSLFETHRNNGFGVARARQDVLFTGAEFKAPKLIRNEFGGSLSGPVVFPPKLFGPLGYDGHNRTFFFVSSEGRESINSSTRDYNVPTAAMRAGDFSGLIDSQGRKITLYDPLTTRIQTINGRQVAVRDPFPNNQIPLARMSPLAKYLWSITPLPNDAANPLVSANLRTVIPAILSNRITTVKLDHRFGERDNVYLRVAGNSQQSFARGTNTGSGPPVTGLVANSTSQPRENIAGSFGWTHVFSPTFYAETLVTRTWQNIFLGTRSSGRNVSQELGLPNPFEETGWPAITNIGLGQYVEGDGQRIVSAITTIVDQNYSLVRGAHQFQFGGRYTRDRLHILADQGAVSGSASFNSLATALHSPTLGTPTNPLAVPQTGNDAANFFLGYAATYSAGLKRKWLRINSQQLGLYAQDNWKISNRLTLIPGVRWDISPAAREKDSLINAFDPKSRALALPEPLEFYYKLGVSTPQAVALFERVGVKFTTTEQVGLPKTLFDSNYFDIGPRLGFAYRLFDGQKQLVIRGGYGIYFSPVAARWQTSPFSTMPPFQVNYTYNPNSAAQSPDGIPNYLLRSAPTIVAGVNSANVIDFNRPVSIGRGVGVSGLADETPTPRVHEWNLTLEKQLDKSTVFRASYRGKHGLNLHQQQEINPQPNDFVWYTTTGQPLPTGEFANVARRVFDQTAYTSIRLLARTGYLNSSEFSFELQRRFSKGLGFQVFYNLLNTLRVAGTGANDQGTRPEVYLPGTVPTDFDQLNRFLFYDRDTMLPKHRVRWNWNYELPFGKGKPILRNAGGFLNALIGGWKLSGIGTLRNTWYAMPTDNWGEFGKFETYNKKYKITDCRATPATATNPSQERCTDGYLWFNGYLSERFINSKNAAGLRNGVYGLPADYKPAQKPRTPWPKGGLPTDPGAADYDTNVTYITLKNGNTVRVGYDTGVHPWRNQYFLGPWNWFTDASLLKYFTIKEKVRLRVNVDAFNVFNRQGFNPPGSDGISSLGFSYNASSLDRGFQPRILQGSLRIEW